PETWVSMCPVAKGLLQKLVTESGARVVLSSSWRLSSTWRQLAEFFGFPITNIGHNLMEREDAILKVLEDPTCIGLSNEEVEAWVSLDDMYMEKLEDMPGTIL